MKDVIVEYVNKLKKEKKLSIGVTNIIRMTECPLQSIFYSNLTPIVPSKTKSLVTGVLSHYSFEQYYEYIETYSSIPSLDEVVEMAVNKLKTERKDEYSFFMKNYDSIITLCEKYTSCFMRWAQYNPIPFRRELLIKKGLVVGIVDRIDKIGNKLIITDYKTSNSAPNERLLIDYKTQIGGYLWLVSKSDIGKNVAMLPPRIVVFRKASWVTYVIDDYLYHLNDFVGLVRQTAKVIIELLKGNVPKGNIGDRCYYCLVKDYCDEYKNKF